MSDSKMARQSILEGVQFAFNSGPKSEDDTRERIEWVEFVGELLTWVTKGCDQQELSEVLNSLRIADPKVLGQLLMVNLTNPLATPGYLDYTDKKWWTEVAEVIGPDWIAQLKRVANFMERVDSFS